MSEFQSDKFSARSGARNRSVQPTDSRPQDFVAQGKKNFVVTEWRVARALWISCASSGEAKDAVPARASERASARVVTDTHTR
jgi:hypothetical protein